jgi:hypothetical protein
MSEELLACPFCGGDGEIVVDYVLGPNEPLYAPMCEHYADWWENRFVKKYPNGPICQGSAGTNFHTKEEAIAAWNRRTQPASDARQVWIPVAPMPDWSQAPDWAMWWSVDAYSEVSWHEMEPKLDGTTWWAERRYQRDGRIIIPLGIDWRTTLQQRPQSTT